jgi:hypothetical protein
MTAHCPSCGAPCPLVVLVCPRCDADFEGEHAWKPLARPAGRSWVEATTPWNVFKFLLSLLIAAIVLNALVRAPFDSVAVAAAVFLLLVGALWLPWKRIRFWRPPMALVGVLSAILAAGWVYAALLTLRDGSSFPWACTRWRGRWACKLLNQIHATLGDAGIAATLGLLGLACFLVCLRAAWLAGASPPTRK